MADLCTLLAWDSEYWGFPVARINGSKLSEGTVKEVIRWCGKHKIRCLYFAADGTCAGTLQAARNHGFRFVDVRVDMQVGASYVAPATRTDGECREARREDLSAMARLARTAHEDTRFFKDTNFDRQKAAEIYALWIARDFREHKVFAATAADTPGSVLGYATANMAENETGRIGLVAVSPAARGRGLGHLLVKNAVAWCQSCGAKGVRVATQGTNVAALRLYEGYGFRVAEVKVWFHRWFELETPSR